MIHTNTNDDKNILKIKKELKKIRYRNGILKKTLRKKENEIKSLLKDLNAAQESSMRKLEFITHLSHEFKTPLNAIIGFTSLMEEKELSREKQVKFCRNILSASNHLLHMTEYTIDMARAETDKIMLNFSEFVPLDVIKEVLAILEEQVAKKHVNVITYFDSVPIIADKRRFKQLIFNLVGNAIKFNKQGGTIKISTFVQENSFKFEISDTGKGIAPDEQDKIFEFFSNLHTHRLDNDCTGVGLSLCKKIVKLHKGEINFSSEPDKGSRFWFSIPVAPVTVSEPFAYINLSEQNSR